MREEQVTKNILNWLKRNQWEIICFDFPQSGTGIYLHPNKEFRTTKNKKAIIPDIVAVKEDISVFFENKNRFFEGDFLKINELKRGNDYSVSINKLLDGYDVFEIYYGIGIPNNEKDIKKTENYLDKIDFLITTDEEENIYIKHDVFKIFY